MHAVTTQSRRPGARRPAVSAPREAAGHGPVVPVERARSGRATSVTRSRAMQGMACLTLPGPGTGTHPPASTPPAPLGERGLPREGGDPSGCRVRCRDAKWAPAARSRSDTSDLLSAPATLRSAPHTAFGMPQNRRVVAASVAATATRSSTGTDSSGRWASRTSPGPNTTVGMFPTVVVRPRSQP